jgi:Zn-dependent protease/predicted transcriptional regulator
MGFQIKVDPSWFLIAALVIWTLASGYFPETVPGLSFSDYLGLAFVAMFGLFAGLILHELAHSLVARRFGLGIGGITLFIFGGVAELDEEPASPRSEFWIAIAGPAMSLALAGLAAFLDRALGQVGVSAPFRAVLQYLALINLVLAVFNLLPAFPLDGGRVLRAILWRMTGDLVWATRTASIIATFFAYALMALGLLSLFSGGTIGGLWQVLIGFFLLTAARSTYEQVLIKSALAGKTVGALMTSSVWQASPEDTLDTVVNEMMLRHAVSFVPVTEGDHLLGYVDAGLLREIDRENWGDTHVSDVYVAANGSNTVRPDLPTEELMRHIAATGRRKFLVARDERFLGVVTLTDLLSYLSVLNELRPRRSAVTGPLVPPGHDMKR